MGNKVYNSITKKWEEGVNTTKVNKVSNISSTEKTYNAVTGEWSNNILPTQNKKSTWFNKGAFDDGYQKGDVIKTVAGTVYDVSGSFLSGIGSIIEGTTDALKYTRAGLHKLYGEAEEAEKVKKQAAEENDFENFLGIDKNKTSQYSLLGDKSENIIQGVGYYAGMIALQSLGVPWQATASVTTASSSLGEAYSNNATTKQALIYALGSTIAEVGSEYLVGGIKLPGTGKTTEKIIEGMTSKIKNQLSRKLVTYGINSAGEGIEEVISGAAQEMLKRVTYASDEEKSILQNAISGAKDYAAQQAAGDFFAGILVTTLSGAVGINKFGNNINNIPKKENTNIETSNKQNKLSSNNRVPTVQEVVAQEKNSATASDELNPQSWTSKTDSGTSSFANNIAQSNESVNYNLDREHVSKNISQDIDNVLNNINERNPVRLRDYTPSILVKNGIKDLPMYENPAHIRKNILTETEAKKIGLSINSRDHYHGLGKDLYIKAIDSLDNPRVIFKRNNGKDYLILTTLKDNKNNNIIVPIEIETSTRVNKVKLDINR